MIARVTCVLLLFFACYGAEDIDSVALKDEIVEAQKNVNNMSARSVAEVRQVISTITEISKYFETSKLKYMKDAKDISVEYENKLKNMSNTFIGEAIDKNKPVNTFKCILKANEEMVTAIKTNFNAQNNCINGVFTRQAGELDGLTNQLILVRDATTGLFNTIVTKLSNCTISGEITELVHRAEMRENNLKKVLRAYEGRATDLRQQYNEAQMSCSRTARASCENALKVCSNKMKGC